MKKIFLIIALIISYSGVSLAQTAAPVKQTATKTSTTTHVTQSGKPDKRFKENKMETTKAAPLKKDGTPDMRYKANKKTTTVQKSTTN